MFLELFIFGGIIGVVIFFLISGIYAATYTYKLSTKQEAEKEVTNND